MKALFFGALALAVASIPAAAQPQQQQQQSDIGGRYRVIGKNPNGSEYSGTAQIAVTSRNTCRIVWNTGNESRGWCMRRGGVLAAGYVMDRETIGLVVYEIKPDGTLEGTWTVADKPGVGLEVLQPQR